MNSFFLALQFLTRFPIPYETNFNESEAGKSLFWFPFISAFMGFLVGCAQNITFPIAPQVSGFVALMVLYLLNGGLHLDGLADTADGFLSYRDRDETLRIMHDSTIGTYGVVALVFLLLGEYAVFSSVMISPVNLAILLASSRIGVLFSIYFFPTATSSTLGNFFKQKSKPLSYIFQWVMLSGAILIIRKPQMILFPIVALLFSYFFSRVSMKKIGGVSGDVYGAIMDLSTLLLLLIYGVWMA